MLLILKLLTFIYAVGFTLVISAMCVFAIFLGSMKPDSLKSSIDTIELNKIQVKDFKSSKLEEKYARDTTVEEIIASLVTPSSLNKEDAIKLINSDEYKNAFITGAYNTFLKKEVTPLTDVELKKITDQIEITNIDYKETAKVFNEKVSTIKISKYDNNQIYNYLLKISSDIDVYIFVFAIASYLIFALFTLSVTKPMQYVGYPFAIIGTICVCASILMSTFLGKIGLGYKLLFVPIFKSSLLKYGIIYIVIGMALAIIYEIISNKKVDPDKDLYSFTVAPQVGPNPNPNFPAAPANQTTPQMPSAPPAQMPQNNNQIS